MRKKHRARGDVRGIAPEGPSLPGLWKQVQRPGLLGKLLGR